MTKLCFTEAKFCMSSGEPDSSNILTAVDADNVGQRFQPVPDPNWSADFQIGPARRMQIHFQPQRKSAKMLTADER
jgi:hypothetical protein